MEQAREHAGQALRLQWGAIELALRALSVALRVSGYRFAGWARVRGYRLCVRGRRWLARYMRRHARARRLVLAASVITLVAVLADRPSALVTVTAVAGLTGITAARLAPGKVLKADVRKTVARMYGQRH